MVNLNFCACIRKLDNDDVDGKPDSTDEDTQLWCSVKRTLVASDEIQVNVMQKSVVYWKWPNVSCTGSGQML